MNECKKKIIITTIIITIIVAIILITKFGWITFDFPIEKINWNTVGIIVPTIALIVTIINESKRRKKEIEIQIKSNDIAEFKKFIISSLNTYENIIVRLSNHQMNINYSSPHIINYDDVKNMNAIIFNDLFLEKRFLIITTAIDARKIPPKRIPNDTTVSRIILWTYEPSRTILS